VASKLEPILGIVFTPPAELDDMVEALAGEGDEEVDYQLDRPPLRFGPSSSGFRIGRLLRKLWT
jgi:hypothetical protein